MPLFEFRPLGLSLRAGPINDFVDDSVILGLLRIHDEIALNVSFDAVQRLTGVPRHQVVGDFPDAQNFPSMNVNVRGLAAESTHRRLMDENT
jgi:hypothetical protein